MPNPDGSMTAAERQKALLTIGSAAPDASVAWDSGALRSPNEQYNAQIDHDVSTGQNLGGADRYNSNNQQQNAIFSNLSNAQAQVKQQGDFGLGTNNNAATSAMLGNAGATADKYSSEFGADADHARTASAAAGNRGIGAYQGNTVPYSNALSTAASDHSLQTGAYNQLMDFAAKGPGPSAAQAQLTQSTDANERNALALARSGRGMGGSQAALRSAIAQNATTQQGSNAQAAELRANENTAFQAQRLGAITSAGGVAGQTVQADQGLATTGLAGAQYQTDTALKGTQLNDATSQAWSQQQQNAQQQALGAEVGGQTQQLNINASALAGRESEWADANQTYGINKGAATTAGIADANRQQAYVGAGLSAAGTVIGAVSDENAKTNIQPLSAVQPLNSQTQSSSSDTLLPSKAASDASQKEATNTAIGGTAGSVAGGAVGTAVGGPVGTAVGSFVGGIAGKAIGKALSDVRNKQNIQPLSASAKTGAIMQDAGSQLMGGKGTAYQELMAKYGGEAKQPASSAADVADYAKAKFTPKAVDKAALDQSYRNEGGSPVIPKGADAKVPTARFADVTGTTQGVFSRSDHPILSKGDALLADSARNAPGSMFNYKDPADGPGTYVSPMAQDLAAHPVTRGAVGQDPASGKLYVDGARLASVNTAQNHSQQNQIDTLDDKISSLEAMLDASKKRQQQQYQGGVDSMGNQFMGAR